MPQPSYLTTFVHEVEDLLERIEAALLALETTPGDRELIHQLFRAFHTLKGSAGVAGVASIQDFTHHVETAMDHVRSGAVALTPPLVSTVLASKDHVAALLATALGGPAHDPAVGNALVAQLHALSAVATDAAAAPSNDRSGADAPPAAPAQLLVDYLVTFRLSDDLDQLAALELAPGAPPQSLIDQLGELGACTVIATPDAPAPMVWQFVVTTTQDENAIHDVFIFFAGAGELRIERGLSQFTDPPVEAAPAPSPALTASVAAPPSSASPVAAAPAAPRIAVKTESTVRVSSERLDHLVKLIGELVITQSRLQEACSRTASPELTGPVESFERLIADLRDGVLSLRMVPIGTLFTRFHRLIRDLSGELDKEVELVTAGDDTELDKTVIDQLGDAVVHVLRNSMDHGIESPDARVAAGKPRKGTLRLTAAHESTHVVITIADDGRGIDLAAVRRKAEGLGLIAPGEVLSEQDTIALVVRPGFSTAASVTQLSGRGVGMDVVKRTVEALRGSLAIASRAGHGTEIRLTLPLTLAIIDGLLVEIDRDRFVVPLAAVTENLELTAADRRMHNGRNVVALRGELVPYIRLRELFHVTREDPDLEKVVIVSVEGQRIGLVVDRVIGSHQTVIQPLGQFYRGVDLFSGTTIMGDGRVAMILDLAGTVRVGDRGSSSRSGAKVLS